MDVFIRDFEQQIPRLYFLHQNDASYYADGEFMYAAEKEDEGASRDETRRDERPVRSSLLTELALIAFLSVFRKWLRLMDLVAANSSTTTYLHSYRPPQLNSSAVVLLPPPLECITQSLAETTLA